MIALRDKEVCLIVKLLEHYKDCVDKEVELKGRTPVTSFSYIRDYNDVLLEQSDIEGAIKLLKEAYHD